MNSHISSASQSSVIVDNQINEALAHQLCDDLVQQAWSQHDHFLSRELILSLAAECRALHEKNSLKQARIGRAQETHVQTNIRSDQIAWLEAGQSAACDAYLQIMDQLRITLNQALYLGLEEYESHFAFYAPGAAYSKHLDRFHSDDARTVSVVLYLNEDWQTEQGGALRLYPPQSPTQSQSQSPSPSPTPTQNPQENTSQDIYPEAGRIAIFLSADMPHEVLPATRDRMSLTGWFKRRGTVQL